MPTSIIKITSPKTEAQLNSVYKTNAGRAAAQASIANYLDNLFNVEPCTSFSFTNSEDNGVAASVTFTFTSTGPTNGQSGSIGGRTLAAVTSGAVPANGQFNINATPATVAESFLTAVNAFVPGVIATRVAGVVTVTARDKGVQGNLITSSAGTLSNVAASAAALAGGVDATYTTFTV